MTATTPMLFDAMTAEEIASQNLSEVAYEMPDFRPTSEDAEAAAGYLPSPDDFARVDRYLRAFRYYTDRLAEIEATTLPQAADEIARIETWRDAQTRDERNALAYLSHQLQSFSEAIGREKHASPNGKLGWTKGRERVVFSAVDPETGLPMSDAAAAADFCALWEGSKFVTTTLTRTPSKKEIAAHAKAEDEMPAGADMVRSESTFKITPA